MFCRVYQIFRRQGTCRETWAWRFVTDWIGLDHGFDHTQCQHRFCLHLSSRINLDALTVLQI